MAQPQGRQRNSPWSRDTQRPRAVTSLPCVRGPRGLARILAVSQQRLLRLARIVPGENDNNAPDNKRRARKAPHGSFRFGVSGNVAEPLAFACFRIEAVKDTG